MIDLVIRIIRKTTLFVLFLAFAEAGIVHAQQYNMFKAPTIRKVKHADRAQFHKRFKDIKWTGQGLYQKATIDHVPTIELRARLQTLFGNPTQTLPDMVGKKNFRPGMFVEFEYWFVVNDSIPMMVLDVDGPFENGLVYVGASRYIDLMPEVKRTLSKQLMDVKKLGDFKDYFYSPEREKWFLVEHENGKFSHNQISQPKGLHFPKEDMK